LTEASSNQVSVQIRLPMNAQYYLINHAFLSIHSANLTQLSSNMIERISTHVVSHHRKYHSTQM
jgi:transposase